MYLQGAKAVVLFVLLAAGPALAQEREGAGDEAFSYGHGGRVVIDLAPGVLNVTKPGAFLGLGYALSDSLELSAAGQYYAVTGHDLVVYGRPIAHYSFGEDYHLTAALKLRYFWRGEYAWKVYLGLLGGGGFISEHDAVKQVGGQIKAAATGEAAWLGAALAGVLYDFSPHFGLFGEFQVGLSNLDLHFPVHAGLQVRF